jgi:2,3-bisphosphoglycerate-independent phosphoglycerate mutase
MRLLVGFPLSEYPKCSETAFLDGGSGRRAYAAFLAMDRLKPVILVIIDGFGIAPGTDGNAIRAAKMPVLQKLIESYPAMTLRASAEAVGLSWGEMGNSEVGHLTIGSGRIFYQSYPRISMSIENGEFFENAALVDAIEHAKKTGGTLHLMGLVSPGAVHASDEHLYALLRLCKRKKFDRVAVHAFLDGRDTIFNSAVGFIESLEKNMAELKIGKIATLSGRFYAMDRDNRWDRIQKAYDAMVLGTADATATSATQAISESYARSVFDEEFVPTVITKNGKPIATVKDHDACIFFNFRPDRARELTKAFVLPSFDKFPRTPINDLSFTTFTEYEKDLPVHIAYPPQLIESCLARVISDAGLRQLHIAETEKYAHVTFFLNGMNEAEYPGEDRAIIPSPRVSTYDKAPEMSALQISERVAQEVVKGQYDFIVLNFANPDMVGHTGDEKATIVACETVDKAIGQIVDAAFGVGGAVLITADHGNAEEVKNLTTGEIDKEHSTNPVPFIIAGKAFEGLKAPTGDVLGGDLALTPPVGMLADVAPTVLKLLNLPIPQDMTGRPLI